MKTSSKWAVGLGVASGVLLATLLVTTEKGKKTRSFIARRAKDLRAPLRYARHQETGELEVHYI